jgi:hypothetical protein
MEPFGAFVNPVSLNREAYCIDGCCRSQSRSSKLFSNVVSCDVVTSNGPACCGLDSRLAVLS